MPTTDKKINISTLDFEDIKSSLKEFLQGQEEFSDYNFEGSALSTLLDLLAANTHFNALLANLSVNEMFLDSASKRSSVVSHAKNLGYVPTSSRGARATVNVTVNSPSGDPDSLTLPAQSIFTTIVDGNSYNFYNEEALVTTPVDGEYIFEDVEIVEGTPLRNRFTVTSGARFIIPNTDVDLTTLIVKVQANSSTVEYTTYTLASTIIDINSDSTVYFLKEIEGELYEVYFGDGVLGKELETNNVVTIEYFVTHKTEANGARRFSFSGTVGGGSVVVTTVEDAAGGSNIESIDSIKFRAPLSYASQNRAVTADDYKILLPQLYSNIDSLNIWGGEDNDPPIYGKVFIAIKPRSGETLTNATKDIIKNDILKNKNIVSIIPEIVDPEYLYVIVNSTVYYDPKRTSKTEETLKAIVKETIVDYNTENLNDFGSIFRYSKLLRTIDDSDPAILGNITTVKIRKDVTVSLGSEQTYIIHFNNPIWNSNGSEDAVLTSGFKILGNNNTMFIADNGEGILRLFYFQTPGVRAYLQNIGTVDYDAGTVTISDITITTATDNILEVTVVPKSNDIVSVRDQLVSISEEDIVTGAVIDKSVSGEFSGGTNYIFTSSR